jgi:hypothetical protein
LEKRGEGYFMIEFCPGCNAMKAMDWSETEREEPDDQGKPVKIITKSYYCSVCHTFVCSEDEIAED